MIKETNPVEQRIEALADKWEDATGEKKGRIIRIHAKREETEMVDTFFWYMLGLDSLVEDIAFILDPFFVDSETYSHQLTEALEEIIKTWNESNKKEGIDYVPVDWNPDYNLVDRKNPAKLFVDNFNRLAKSLDLEKGRLAVAVLPVPHTADKEKEIREWMAFAIKAEIAPAIRFLVSDIEESPFYDKLLDDFPNEVVTIVPDFDMSNVMAQVAAMGDPSDPSTPYRIAFTEMMNAMQKNREKKTIEAGETCIRIATENIPKDPQWAVQIVVVQVALSGDQLKYKNYKKSLERADKAVKTATGLPELLGESLSLPVIAQAYMNRASVHCFFKEWKQAVNDFVQAAEAYKKAFNRIMAIEAYRMAGFSSDKAWDFDSVKYYATGIQLASTVDKQLLASSTFPYLVKQLLKKNYREEITYEEIDEIVSPVYGIDWPEVIEKFGKKTPDLAMINN